jgi:hypothetical protein
MRSDLLRGRIVESDSDMQDAVVLAQKREVSINTGNIRIL